MREAILGSAGLAIGESNSLRSYSGDLNATARALFRRAQPLPSLPEPPPAQLDAFTALHVGVPGAHGLVEQAARSAPA